MVEDGNAFTEICSVTEPFQWVVWWDQTAQVPVFFAPLHVVAYVFSLLLFCMGFCGNEIFVGSKQTFICLSPICSMCNSGNPCHLHVCALGVSVGFVCGLCAFLGVIF